MRRDGPGWDGQDGRYGTSRHRQDGTGATLGTWIGSWNTGMYAYDTIRIRVYSKCMHISYIHLQHHVRQLETCITRVKSELPSLSGRPHKWIFLAVTRKQQYRS